MLKDFFKILSLSISGLKSSILDKIKTLKIKASNPTLLLEENVQIKNGKKLFLGNNIIIQKGTILHCGGFEWCGYKGKILIGSNSVISPYCVFYGAGGITIGENFDCGPGVMIFSGISCHNNGQNKKKHLFSPVKIGNDVIIYSNSIINMGISIGNRAVIGANSLVLCDIPPGEFWAGSPAKFIKKIS